MEKAGTIRSGALSITGNFRENNEDRFAIDPQSRFFLVADGMGGQSAGERASALAVEVIAQKLLSLIDFNNSTPHKCIQAIDKAVHIANTEIMALGELEPTCRNMGTTITFIVNVGGSFYIGGVGDSRVYRIRNQRLEQLTEDHSVTSALVKAGTITAEAAKTHRYRNVLYRSLGTKEGGTGTSPRQITPISGDRYILCSDGVTDGISNEEIQSLASENADPQQAAEAIIKAAQAGGSKDNITCVVVHVD